MKVISKRVMEKAKNREGYPWRRKVWLAMGTTGNGGGLEWWCSSVPALLTLQNILLASLSMMVLLQLTPMMPDGCYGGDDEGLQWWRGFYPVVALCLSSEVAMLPSHSLYNVFPMQRSLLSPLLVVMMVKTMRADDCCSGDEECWWWFPSIYPVVVFSIRWVCSPAFLSQHVAMFILPMFISWLPFLSLWWCIAGTCEVDSSFPFRFGSSYCHVFSSVTQMQGALSRFLFCNPSPGSSFF